MLQRPAEPEKSQEKINSEVKNHDSGLLKVSDLSYNSIKKFIESKEDIMDISRYKSRNLIINKL